MPLLAPYGYQKVLSWGNFQHQAFVKVKNAYCVGTTAKTEICADVSSYALGAVLLQQHSQQWLMHPEL